MSNTPIFGTLEMEPGQLNSEIIFNTTVRVHEAMSGRRALTNDLPTPPVDPEDGDVHIVGSTASDDWDGHEDEIAIRAFDAWHFVEPQTGWVWYVEALDDFIVFRGNTTQAWEAYP